LNSKRQSNKIIPLLLSPSCDFHMINLEPYMALWDENALKLITFSLNCKLCLTVSYAWHWCWHSLYNYFVAHALTRERFCKLTFLMLFCTCRDFCNYDLFRP